MAQTMSAAVPSIREVREWLRPRLAVFERAATDGERDRLHRLPDVQIEEWEGDGHFVHLVDPARFATRLLAFIAHCNQTFRPSPAIGQTQSPAAATR